MARLKQIGMAAGTFSVALGIGFIMQNGDALASRFGADSSSERPAPFSETTAVDVDASVVLPDNVDPTAKPVAPAQAGLVFSDAPVVAEPELTIETAVVLPEVAKIPAPQAAPVQLANLDPEAVPAIQADVLAAEIDCVPVMSATADTAAMVALTITAPCHTTQAFVVHHQGMMFSAMTDEAGSADMVVPALAEVSVMIAAFADGDGAVATAVVEDFASFDRAVLQWQGETSIMLSAYEGAANFGDAAHIHADNPGDMERLTSSSGGYLIRLGDETVEDAMMAEIYTFPSGSFGNTPDVMLVAEAEITAANCGQEMSAQSIQVAPSGQTSALDLTMVMPDCDAVGDFLILQNMFEDLTLAAR